MPRRKKLPNVPNYLNNGISGTELTVQKASPLRSLSETSLTLSEFKILDVYLSRINSHEPDKRYVRFEKGELEKLLGVERIRKDELSKRLDNLFTAVTLHDENKPKGFIKIGLFSKAEANIDDDGLWQVDLACTPEAMEYIFNIDNIGYLRYKLKNVIELTSRYSYVLYLYLEQNRFRKSWEVSLPELKKILNCTANTYSQYYRFNDLILKKCQKELQEKTTLSFSYFPVKKGRKVVAIRFTVSTLSEDKLIFVETMHSESLTEQLSFSEVSYTDTEKNSLQGFTDALNNEFSTEQVKVLADIITFVRDEERTSYLQHKYAELNFQEERNRKNNKKISNRFSYLKKIIENDYEKSLNKTTEKKNGYDATYDIEEYESHSVLDED